VAERLDCESENDKDNDYDKDNNYDKDNDDENDNDNDDDNNKAIIALNRTGPITILIGKSERSITRASVRTGARPLRWQSAIGPGQTTEQYRCQ
jgi:hypothetical protein